RGLPRPAHPDRRHRRSRKLTSGSDHRGSPTSGRFRRTTMTDRLKDKVTLITGTGSGIGRAAALRFAAEGARVVGCDINPETAQETVQLVTDSGGRMISQAPVDLADPKQVAEWVDNAINQF